MTSFVEVAKELLDGKRQPQAYDPAPRVITPLARTVRGEVGAALCLVTQTDGYARALLGVFEREGGRWVNTGVSGAGWSNDPGTTGVTTGSTTIFGRDSGHLAVVTGIAAEGVADMHMTIGDITVPVEICSESRCFIALACVKRAPERAELSFRHRDGVPQIYPVSFTE